MYASEALYPDIEGFFARSVWRVYIWDMTARIRSAPRTAYPTPRDLGIALPPDFVESRFNGGFAHALKGGQLTRVEYFRRSFRLGFRTAKLYLREVRRAQGVLEFPFRARVRLRSLWG
jgi:hypothetical protein